MISHILKSHKLLTPVSRSVVYLPKKPRRLFEKSLPAEDYEINPLPPAKHYKPRLPQWSDPNVVWPPVIPAATRLKGKALLLELEQEEKSKFTLLKPYTVPDFRSGDIIKFHYLHSISEGKGNEFTGLCMGLTRKNSLHASFWVMVRVAGLSTLFNVKLNSPFLAHLEILKRGSGNHKSKLFYMIKNLKASNKFTTPIIKGQPKARRGEMKIPSKKPNSTAVIYDPVKE